MPLGIRTLAINQVVDCAIAPKNGTVPVTLTDIKWFSGSSAVLVTPSPDGLTCRVSCDPSVPASALVGVDVQVSVTGGGNADWVTFTITDAAGTVPATATSLGLTVGTPFTP